MKISSGDIDALVTEMDYYSEAGFYAMSYKEDEAHLKTKDIDFFSDHFDQQVHWSHYPDDQIVSIKPVLEVLKIIQEKATVLKGDWSLPLDIGLIHQNYQLRKEYKNTIMNLENVKPENLEAMEKRLLYTGMGDISREDLMRHMSEGKPQFSLDLKAVYPDGTAEVKVNCKLSEKNNYYPDNYDITVRQEGKAAYTRNYDFKSTAPVLVKTENGELEKKWINSTIALKEAYNQMCGAAINKDYVFVNREEPEKNRLYNAWEKIDFTKVDDKGQHPVEKIYKLHPDEILKELKATPLLENKDNEQLQRLVDSICRGNTQVANYVKVDGTTEQIHLKANPEKEMLNKYDEHMNPMILSLKREQEVTESLQQKQEQNQNKDVKQTEGQKAESEEQTVKKKRGQKVS